LLKDFEPFRALWVTASDWLRWHDSWMNDALVEVDAEKVDKNVMESYKTIHKSVKVFQDTAGQ
jgi:dynein heavy chain, axonemal